jgi:hypothetical protein
MRFQEVNQMECDRVDNAQELSIHEVKEDQKPYRGPAMAVVGTVGELTGGPVTFIAETNGFHN